MQSCSTAGGGSALCVTQKRQVSRQSLVVCPHTPPGHREGTLGSQEGGQWICSAPTSLMLRTRRLWRPSHVGEEGSPKIKSGSGNKHYRRPQSQSCYHHLCIQPGHHTSLLPGPSLVRELHPSPPGLLMGHRRLHIHAEHLGTVKMTVAIC